MAYKLHTTKHREEARRDWAKEGNICSSSIYTCHRLRFFANASGQARLMARALSALLALLVPSALFVLLYTVEGKSQIGRFQVLVLTYAECSRLTTRRVGINDILQSLMSWLPGNVFGAFEFSVCERMAPQDTIVRTDPQSCILPSVSLISLKYTSDSRNADGPYKAEWV